MQVFLNENIMHSLNHTLTMLPSYWDKTSVQLTVSTFSRKKTLSIVNLNEGNAYLSPLFHHYKTIKIVDKVKVENFLFINKHANK